LNLFKIFSVGVVFADCRQVVIVTGGRAAKVIFKPCMTTPAVNNTRCPYSLRQRIFARTASTLVFVDSAVERS
jgi:hypothetical protein